jgi:dihydropteroate synthase
MTPLLEAKDTVFISKKTLNLGGKLLDLSVPAVMGILNVTPDSFFDGGSYLQHTAILKQAEAMLDQGASILDIGGYSSRPGAAEVSVEEEIARVLPAIKIIRQHFPESVLSIDTFRSIVAEAAVKEGALIINDISGGTLDKQMFATAGKLKAAYILMHMRGTPQTMQGLTDYDDLLFEIIDFFQKRLAMLHQHGVRDILLDPGFGFAKTEAQNYSLLRHLSALNILERPILAGLSRKSMIYKRLGTVPEEALNGTTVLNTLALMGGASILRVHDVRPAVEAVKLYEATAKAY